VTLRDEAFKAHQAEREGDLRHCMVLLEAAACRAGCMQDAINFGNGVVPRGWKAELKRIRAAIRALAPDANARERLLRIASAR